MWQLVSIGDITDNLSNGATRRTKPAKKTAPQDGVLVYVRWKTYLRAETTRLNRSQFLSVPTQQCR